MALGSSAPRLLGSQAMDVLAWLEMQSVGGTGRPPDSATGVEGEPSQPQTGLVSEPSPSHEPCASAPCEPPPLPEATAEPQPPQFDAADVPEHIRGSKYEKWFPYLEKRFSRFRKKRGRQLRPLRAASICTGTSPEDRVYHLFSVEYLLEFLCDNKDSSFQWCQSNCKQEAKRFFYDLKELAQTHMGMDIQDDMLIHEVMAGLAGKLDQLFAGISCKGFAMSRHGRGQNWASHSDIWMAEAFLCLLLLILPRFASVENVEGFLKRDTVGNGSPLLRFLQRCIQLKVTDHYIIVVVVLRGDLWLKFSRRRVFINFYEKEDGGEQVVKWSIRMLKDGSEYLVLTSKY